MIPAQLQALKTDIAANVNTIPVGQPWTGAFGGVAVKNVPNNGDGNAAIAGWYNLTASPSYFVVRTDAPVGDILNNIVWGNFTPAPAVTSGNAAQATACSAYCQGKMLNLQTMTFGRSSFDATRATQTGGLKDATTQLPSAAAFANQPGGWTAIIPILQRTCRNVEKLFAVASTIPALQNVASTRGTQYDGASGNPDIMSFEGSITGDDVQNARNLP